MKHTYPARVKRAPQLDAGQEESRGGAPEGAYFWQAEISSNRLDSYHTYMTEATLGRFAEDARVGVAFLDSHAWGRLPIGYSVDAQVEDSEDGARRVLATFYTVRGITFGGTHSYASTDDLIAAIDAGIVRDVSVGFSGGSWTCNICGNDYRDYNACGHLAGMEYSTKVGEAPQLCTVAIDGAALSEVSAVYDGATPGAMILKARNMAGEGLLKGKALAYARAHYLPDMAQDGPFGSEDKRMDYEKFVGDIREIVAHMDLASDADADAVVQAVRELKAQVVEAQGLARLADVELDSLRARLEDLQPLADVGQVYLQDLREQVMAEGVRAFGEAFPVETYRVLVGGASIEHLKSLRESFAGQASQRFAGGRKTSDGQGQGATRKVVVPDEAYRVA